MATRVVSRSKLSRWLLGDSRCAEAHSIPVCMQTSNVYNKTTNFPSPYLAIDPIVVKKPASVLGQNNRSDLSEGHPGQSCWPNDNVNAPVSSQVALNVLLDLPDIGPRTYREDGGSFSGKTYGYAPRLL